MLPVAVGGEEQLHVTVFLREKRRLEERERELEERGKKTARTYAREASTKNIHSTVF